MKRFPFIALPILILLQLSTMAVSAQVSFSARVYVLTTNGKPLDPSFLAFPFCLKVDGEDFVRYQYDTTATVCFNDIAIGSRCHFYYCEFETLYDYPVFTITANTHIDSLVLRPIPKKEELFWTKAQKDSTLFSRATRWSHDLKGHDTLWYDRDEVWFDKESRSLKLARLYYTDWVAPFASWRTWPHAADSAYCYCLLASKQHPYLYYPLRQLAYHLGKTPKLTAPKSPDKRMYYPQPEMPEEWWMDTTVNLFSPWEQYNQENAFARNYTLGKAHEKSLCYPIATDGTIRLIINDPLGWGVLIYRVEGERIYRKRLSIKDNILKDNEHYTLSAYELDSVTTAVDAFHRAGLPDDEIGGIIDGCTFELEYIMNGQYHRYINNSGFVPPQLKAIMELLQNAYKRKQ